MLRINQAVGIKAAHFLHRSARIFAGTLLLLCALVIAFHTSAAYAISQDDLDSINNGTPLYDPDATACSATTLVGGDNIQQAFNYFIGKGLTAVQASGIIGNLEQESGQGLNPAAQENGSKSTSPIPGVGFGIAQWTSGTIGETTLVGRQASLVQLAQSEGQPATSLGVQLDFLWQELTTTYVSTLTALKATTDVTSATTVFMTGYEDPGIPNTANRISNAQAVLTQYGSSASSSVSSSSSGSGSGCSVSCTTSSPGTAGLSQTRQNVICIAEQELALWKAQPGYPYPAYAETGYLKYDQNRKGEFWCADFVSWIYDQAGDPLQTPDWNVPGVPELQQIGVNGGSFQWHPASSGYTPQPGDIAIHGVGTDYEHTSIYIGTTGGVSEYIAGDEYPDPSRPENVGQTIVEEDSFNTTHGYYGIGDPPIVGYISPN